MKIAAAFLALFAAADAKVPFRHVISASQSASPAATYLAYAPDQESFEKLWQNIGGKTDCPPIDFNKEAAIIITAGEKPTSGYSVKVNEITSAKGTLIVDAVVVAPPKGAMTAQVITSPYLVIAVPRAGVSDARWKNPPRPASSHATQ